MDRTRKSEEPAAPKHGGPITEQELAHLVEVSDLRRWHWSTDVIEDIAGLLPRLVAGLHQARADLELQAPVLQAALRLHDNWGGAFKNLAEAVDSYRTDPRNNSLERLRELLKDTPWKDPYEGFPEDH
jgi:hypothetical protein